MTTQERNEMLEMQSIIAYHNDGREDANQRIACALHKEGYRKQGEWISVKDRLPEIDGYYLATAFDYDGEIWGGGTYVLYAEYYNGTWTWSENTTEWDVTDLVTHWMPLPQPPTEKGE